MILIVGLGNPGTNYYHTRHNLGAYWVSLFCSNNRLVLRDDHKLNAKIAVIAPNIYFMIPNSYMNHSGFSVQKFCHYYKMNTEDVLVVHDDLDLNPGDIRLKLSGGHGGHNGLRHIIEQTQSNNFKRLRIGVGHPEIKAQVTEYVLEVPNNQERLLIGQAIEHSWQIVPDIFIKKWQKIMQFLHTPKS